MIGAPGAPGMTDPDLVALVRAFPQARVLVVGDAVLDEWIEGVPRAVAREAPVPTLDVCRRRAVPGGAANTAANVAALGGQARLLLVLGDDDAGDQLRGALSAAGVGTDGCLSQPGRRTRAKRRVVADRHVVARFDEGDVHPVDEATDVALARRLRTAAAGADVVLVADYDGGTLAGPAVRRALARVATERPVLVDAHRVADWARLRPAIVTPNWAELSALVGAAMADALACAGGDRLGAIGAVAEQALERSGAHAVLATVDSDGAVLLRAGLAPLHLPAHPVADPHPAGAGDTLAAALALALAVGAPMPAATTLAVAAASTVVRHAGTTLCTAADLLPAGHGRVVNGDEVAEVAAAHRRAGRRIVVTNGCFDVLHAGHVSCLAAASGFGDVLIVAVNDDAGVAAIKGPGRPVNALADRVEVLAALGTVDHIVAFSGPAPMALLRAVRPDVYVKGADHDVDRLPEATLVRHLGGRVVALPLLPHRSTAGVIAACAALPGVRAS
jgi:rfaE bifunctional protein kinase chain/domain/rfaE bifunctional protein nucleotidyltransferase chain/domain